MKGVKVAGNRGYFLKGNGLLLNQALIAYGMQFLVARQHTPIQTPFFMNKDVMAATAQLEDFDEQLYKVSFYTITLYSHVLFLNINWFLLFSRFFNIMRFDYRSSFSLLNVNFLQYNGLIMQ